jgi:hypothetical protein
MPRIARTKKALAENVAEVARRLAPDPTTITYCQEMFPRSIVDSPRTTLAQWRVDHPFFPTICFMLLTPSPLTKQIIFSFHVVHDVGPGDHILGVFPSSVARSRKRLYEALEPVFADNASGIFLFKAANDNFYGSDALSREQWVKLYATVLKWDDLADNITISADDYAEQVVCAPATAWVEIGWQEEEEHEEE